MRQVESETSNVKRGLPRILPKPSLMHTVQNDQVDFAAVSRDA
jgi:hypothetical protein